MATEPPEQAPEEGVQGSVTGGVCRSSSCRSLHQDYSVEGMSDSLLNFLQHLREFGLVFQRKVCTPSTLASGRGGWCWGTAESPCQD